jgi:hypothetical protein
MSDYLAQIVAEAHAENALIDLVNSKRAELVAAGKTYAPTIYVGSEKRDFPVACCPGCKNEEIRFALAKPKSYTDEDVESATQSSMSSFGRVNRGGYYLTCHCCSTKFEFHVSLRNNMVLVPVRYMQETYGVK